MYHTNSKIVFFCFNGGYGWIREVSNTYIWIFLDCIVVKLLWFASPILFNIIVGPVLTIFRYCAKKFCLGHPKLVIAGCHNWPRTFFRYPPFYLDPPFHPCLLIFRLSVGPPFLLRLPLLFGTGEYSWKNFMVSFYKLYPTVSRL